MPVMWRWTPTRHPRFPRNRTNQNEAMLVYIKRMHTPRPSSRLAVAVSTRATELYWQLKKLSRPTFVSLPTTQLQNPSEMATSQVRQNYHPESEEGVNKQINMELYAMYTYLSMVRLIFLSFAFCSYCGSRFTDFLPPFIVLLLRQGRRGPSWLCQVLQEICRRREGTRWETHEVPGAARRARGTRWHQEASQGRVGHWAWRHAGRPWARKDRQPSLARSAQDLRQAWRLPGKPKSYYSVTK